MDAFLERLRGLGATETQANRLVDLCGTIGEAIAYLKTDIAQYTEYHSEKYNRPYYWYKGAPHTFWDPPKTLLFDEISLDVDLYGLPIIQAKAIFDACHLLMSNNDHDPEVKTRALEALRTILRNIVACENSEPKFRRLKRSNAAFREKVLDVAGGAEILRACGFAFSGDLVSISDSADALPPIKCCLSRVERLLLKKGHTGRASPVDDTKSGRSGRDPGPGFEYQDAVFYCSLCDTPINDGTTRLRTKSHEAPKGEFRFRCSTCADAAKTFDLCERCFDRLSREPELHIPGHHFVHIPPKERLHNLRNAETANNPWGMPLSGSSAARARERLKERTGL